MYDIILADQKRDHPVRRTVWIALAAVAIYVPIVLFGGLPDQLILFPTTGRINPGSAVRRTIPFENGQLEIWTAQSKLAIQRGRPELFILRFYGNADRADYWPALEAEMWGDRAVEIWGVNYPGFGGSTGPARLSRMGSAGLVAFDALKQQADDRPIIVYGASIGTTVALNIAANRSIAGLVLHNPPPLKQMILGRFGWWNLWLLAGPIALQIPADLDNISNGQRTHVRAVFLLSEWDEIVPPRYQRRVVESYAGEKRIIPLARAGHNSPLENAAIIDLQKALDWLLAQKQKR